MAKEEMIDYLAQLLTLNANELSAGFGLSAQLVQNSRMLLSPVVIGQVGVMPDGKLVPAGLVPDSDGALHQLVDTGGFQSSIVYGINGSFPLSTYNAAFQSRTPWSSNTVANSAAQTATDEWKPFTADSTLSGGALANVELVAAVAAKKIEAMVLHFEVVDPVDNAAQANILGAFQDEDDTPVVPPQTVHVAYVWDVTTPSFSSGSIQREYQPHAIWFLTAAVNKALEVDYSGGIGAEKIHISGIHREHA